MSIVNQNKLKTYLLWLLGIKNLGVIWDTLVEL